MTTIEEKGAVAQVDEVDEEVAGQWTVKIRRFLVAKLPPERLIPDRQPAYMASWIYIFGALTIAALTCVILSGSLLAIEGPAWWHLSGLGLFVNSLHLWSVELFFFFMVIHLWGKFFMAAWRGNRQLTWITGVVTFLVSVGAALTGYVSHWRLLQRLELRPDADVAHLPPADRRGGAHRPPRLDGADQGHRDAHRRT